MKKPKPPRARAKAKPTQLSQQPPSPLPLPSLLPPPTVPPLPLPLQVLQTWWGILLALFAAFGALRAPFTTYDFFRSIYADTSPEISVSGDDSQPFALPFRVKNNSHFLPMTSVTWVCRAEDLTLGGITIRDIGFSTIQPPITIWPTRDATFRCSIGADKTISGAIKPELHYKLCGCLTGYTQAENLHGIQTLRHLVG